MRSQTRTSAGTSINAKKLPAVYNRFTFATTTNAKEEKTMTTTNNNDARKATTEKRLATMRANLARLEAEAETLLEKGDAMTAAERMRLLSLVNVAYHDSGKIEGAFSVDSCAACEFCQKMIAAAESNMLIICGSCYAAADAWKEAAWRRHKLNARILSTVLFSREELATLPLGALCRFNEDGDTVNASQAQLLPSRETAQTTMRPGSETTKHAQRPMAFPSEARCLTLSAI